MSTTTLYWVAAVIAALCLVALVLNLTSRRFSARVARNIDTSDAATAEMHRKRREK